MRKLYRAVLVGAFALGIAACSQDVAGPTVDTQFSKQSGSEAPDSTKIRMRCGRNQVWSTTLLKCVLVK